MLHVVESLDRGAVENWLLRTLRHARSRKVDLQWTFYCAVGTPGAFDEEARSLGARVVPSPVPLGRHVPFMRALRREAREGRYDVLHCHHDLVSAVYFSACAGLPIRRRIVHAHNSDETIPTPSVIKRRLLRAPMRWACLAAADRVVGISNHTLDCMLGGRPRRQGRDVVLYYGVSPAPFLGADADRSVARARLGYGSDARLVLYAARIVPEKNPLFALEVFAELARIEPGAVLLMVGSGSEETRAKDRTRDLGIEHSVRFMGWRSDVAAIMAACDLFILPRPEHPMEGFGVAVVEAQLAGLPLLLSRGIPDDPILPRSTHKRLPLSDGATKWARAAGELLSLPRPSSAHAREDLARSPMSMDAALDAVVFLHESPGP